jgi:putative ABC transport system permease protein
MLFNLKSTLSRTLRRPITAIIGLLQITAGVFALATALSLFQQATIKKPQAHIFKLVAFSEKDRTYYSLFKISDLPAIKKLLPTVTDLEPIGYVRGDLIDYAGQRYKIGESSSVSSGFSQLVGLNITKGGFLNKAGELVISESASHLIFGEIDPIGKSVRNYSSWSIGGPSSSYKVVGVIADPPKSQYGGGGGIYNHLYFSIDLKDPSANSGTLLVKAQPEKIEETKAQLLEVFKRQYHNQGQFKDAQGNPYLQIQAIDQASFVESGVNPTQVAFSLFAVVMLISCVVGIFTMQLAENAERTREVGLRQAMGASQKSIVLERVLESIFIPIVGIVLGLSLTMGVLPLLQDALGTTLFRTGLHFNTVVALQVATIVLVFSLLSALYPAIQAAKMRPVEAFRS